MSEGKSAPAPRPVEPASPRGSRNTWLVVAGAAIVCGGVIAAAFSGNAVRARHTVLDDVTIVAEPIGHAPVLPEIADAPMTLATASQSISIEMYTATWCAACQAAHRWMDQEHIAYHEIDVDRHSDAIAQLSVLNPRRTLPTFDVEGQVLVGFDQIALTSAIDGAARRQHAR